MSSAIMRFQKLHTNEEIGHVLGHNKREREIKNADDKRKHLNTSETYVSDVKKHIKGLDKQHKKTTGKKARKDAVRMIEVIMTSDKEFFKGVNDTEYFETCKQWLCDTFGEENMLSMDIHRDERTPHAHFLITPIRGEKYACKQIINGRNAVRGLQNSFFNAVKHFGLERGELVEYTKAKHQSSLQFAEDIQKNKESVSEMTEQEKENYATYGIMAKEQIKELQEENKNLMTENEELKGEKDKYKESFESLYVGVSSMLQGDNAHKNREIKGIVHKGRELLRQNKLKEQEKSKQHVDDVER